MLSLFFFARITFITGLFFGASWSLLLFEHGLDPEITSWILTIGFGMGLVLFPLFTLACLYHALRGTLRRSSVPRWLLLANFMWLLLFITFILFLNGSYYHQS